jgi:tetratricopeptide (TPR) repeat protein
VRLVAAVLLLLGAARGARADEATVAREHFRQGTKLYDLGQYLGAAKEYEAAFRAVDDPSLLFNIGQAYRLGGDAASAVRAYRAFLRRLPDSLERPEVEARIAALNQQIEQQKRESSGRAGAAAPSLTAEAPATREHTPLFKKWWLWTAVGVVAAGAVVGKS